VDDDPVLRSLAADLELDDPALAAFLSSGPAAKQPPEHHHPFAVPVLATFALVALLVTLPVTVAVGVVAALLVVGSPLAVCWLLSDEPPRPRHP
jgi:hypothetical protein